MFNKIAGGFLFPFAPLLSSSKLSSLTASDNVVLPFHFNEIEEVNKSDKKLVIRVPGNKEVLHVATCIMHNILRNNIKEHKGCDVDFIRCMYRGRSAGTPKPSGMQEVVEDLIEHVNLAIKKGYKAENIILYGWSFGGAVATLATEKLHLMGIKVSLFADRTFASAQEVFKCSLTNKSRSLIYVTSAKQYCQLQHC